MALLFGTAAAELAAGKSVVVESNFYAEMDEPRLRALASEHPCHVVQVVCTAPLAVVLERYERRQRSGARHPGHAGMAALEDDIRRISSGRWEAMALPGHVVTVDTSGEAVDVAALASTIIDLF
jgi:predicted kinase